MFDYKIGDTVQLLNVSMKDPRVGMIGIIVNIFKIHLVRQYFGAIM